MRELIVSFILVTTFSITNNTPPPQPVQAQESKTTVQAVEKPQKKKVVKRAPKKQKAVQQAQKQPSVVVRPAAVPQSGTCVDWIRAAGIKDVASAYALIMRESGCRVDADNPYSDAYGIPQSLPGSKMASHGSDWQTNPVTQLKWMKTYVENRYGGFAEANAYQLANNWY